MSLRNVKITLGIIILSLSAFLASSVRNCSLASGEEKRGWIEALELENGTKISLHPESLKMLPGPILRMWARAKYPGYGEILLAGRAAELHTLLEIDCREEKVRELSSFYYDEEGRIIKSVENEGRWQFLPLESSFSTLAKALCGPPK